jgi:UBX domain-containing protein 6
MSTTKASELKSEKEKLNELTKAMELKDHYFGEKPVIDAAPIALKYRILFTSKLLPPGVAYPKEEIENRIEDMLLNQLEDEPILIAVTLLFTANKNHHQKVTTCCEIINKFIDNILKAPDEAKYRKIRLENPTFKEKVYSLKYADLVMKKGGFTACRLPTATSTSEVVEEEDCFIFEGNNFENLNTLKEALQLAEPILPELYRNIQVFHAGPNSNAAKFDFPMTEFYNVNIEDLKKEQKSRNEALEKMGILRTKAMRDKDEQIEQRKYTYCLIRIRLPNEYILQGVFKANETYQALYNFVQETLEYDNIPFDLFGPALRKNLISPETTLSELGLAPAALLSFKWNEDAIAEISQSNDHKMVSDIRKKILKNDLERNASEF